MIEAADSQAIFLLERFSSHAYYSKLLDAWRKFVAHNEACLVRYASNLPHDARSRALPEQADIVWEQTVMPNFRSTLQTVEDGERELLAGDVGGLGAAHDILGDAKGVSDYWNGWMSPEELDTYSDLLGRSLHYATNIAATSSAKWVPSDLTTAFNPQRHGDLDAPNGVPHYRIAARPIFRTGEKVTIAGIYMPDCDHSCPQFLSTAYAEAPRAPVLTSLEPQFASDGSIYDYEPTIERRECVWSLVERVGEVDAIKREKSVHNSQRIPAGERCTATGIYFTPAKPNYRQKFLAGDLMPDLGSDYGLTIWQWDSTQDA